MEMEHLLLRSKCSIFHNIFKNLAFQRRPKALEWNKGLNKLRKSNKKHFIALLQQV